MPSTGPPGCAAVTRWAWRGCSGLAHRRGVPATESRAHDASRPPPRGATWPAAACGGSDTAARRVGRPLGLDRGGVATGPASSGLAWPERGAGVGQRQRAAAARALPGRTAPTEGEPHRPRPTRTDRARAGGQEGGDCEGRRAFPPCDRARVQSSAIAHFC